MARPKGRRQWLGRTSFEWTPERKDLVDWCKDAFGTPHQAVAVERAMQFTKWAQPKLNKFSVNDDEIKEFSTLAQWYRFKYGKDHKLVSLHQEKVK